MGAAITAIRNLRTAIEDPRIPQAAIAIPIIEDLIIAFQEYGQCNDGGREVLGKINSLKARLTAALKGKQGTPDSLINFNSLYEYITSPRGWTADAEMDGHPPPLSVVCTRPFKTYQMGSAVLMQSGKETGFTAHGHEDVQVGDDCIAHTHVCHFTGWYASVITNPKRIAIAGDVYCMAYERGESRNFFDHREWCNSRANGSVDSCPKRYT